MGVNLLGIIGQLIIHDIGGCKAIDILVRADIAFVPVAITMLHFVAILLGIVTKLIKADFQGIILIATIHDSVLKDEVWPLWIAARFECLAQILHTQSTNIRMHHTRMVLRVKDKCHRQE